MSNDNAARIAPLDLADVRRISGAQVLPDMRAAVKELIENAMDAQATNIEVRFKDYGLSLIEVSDNGTGISKENFDALGKRHCTSKLTSFDDLTSVETYGFRGEALASLCTVAQMKIITATQNEAPMGTVLEFDHFGNLTSSDKRQARQRGTTVILSDLLASLPVRRRELEKHVKREYNKAHTMLQAYALISQNIRWTSSIQTTANGKPPVSQLMLRSATGPNYIQMNMAALFGKKAGAAVQSFDLNVSLDEPARLHGVMSKPTMGQGRSSGDRQYFYLNGRPWNCPKLAQICNQVYKMFNSTQYPCVVANLVIGTHTYDVNVSPDKRTLYVHQEVALFDRIREALEAAFSPSQGVFTVKDPLMLSPAVSEKHDREIELPSKSPNMSETPRELESPSRSLEIGQGAAKSSVIPETISIYKASWAAPPLSSTSGMHVSAASTAQPSSGESSMQSQFRRAVANFARKRPSTIRALEYEEADAENYEEHAWTDEDHEHHDDVEQMATSSHRTSARDQLVPQSTVQPPEEQRKGACDQRMYTPSQESSFSEESVMNEAPNRQDRLGQDLSNEPPSTHRARKRNKVHALESSDSEFLFFDNQNGESMPNTEVHGLQQETCRASTPASVGDADIATDELAGSHETVTRGTLKEARDLACLNAQVSTSVLQIEKPQIQVDREPVAVLSYDLAALRHRWTPASVSAAPTPMLGADIEQTNENAAAVMERVIPKKDFYTMRVVGQFNLGFIIARRDTPCMDDLFIIDQHAADEKHNFEDLQRHTKIYSQPLVVPQRIELAPTDELVAREHREWLSKNGFDIDLDEDAPPGSRVRLLSKPVSKGTVFNVQGSWVR
mgnify:FL=1